jgi:tetraacyldisaccharide 4'-kinase
MREKVKEFLIEVTNKKRKNFFNQLLRIFLVFLSFIYILAIKFILFLYNKKILKKFKANNVTISIGNITVGGTGKTPFLIYLVKKLVNRKKQPLIVSRGYAEDEIKELKFFLPSVDVLIGKNRANNIKAALKRNKPEYILLDDAFQHWKVERNLDIVILDVSVSLKDKKVLPAGFLREPISHIKRADVILLTRVNLASQKEIDEIKRILKRIKTSFKIFEAWFEPVYFYSFQNKETIPLNALRGKSVGVFCGIGNPTGFVRTLEGVGLKVASKIFFLDHHRYNTKDLALISRDSEEKELDTYITTFKDILKIDTTQVGARVYCLKIELKFKEKEDENKFFELIPGYFSS